MVKRACCSRCACATDVWFLAVNDPCGLGGLFADEWRDLRHHRQRGAIAADGKPVRSGGSRQRDGDSPRRDVERYPLECVVDPGFSSAAACRCDDAIFAQYHPSPGHADGRQRRDGEPDPDRVARLRHAHTSARRAADCCHASGGGPMAADHHRRAHRRFAFGGGRLLCDVAIARRGRPGTYLHHVRLRSRRLHHDPRRLRSQPDVFCIRDRSALGRKHSPQPSDQPRRRHERSCNGRSRRAFCWPAFCCLLSLARCATGG